MDKRRQRSVSGFYLGVERPEMVVEHLVENRLRGVTGTVGGGYSACHDIASVAELARGC